MPHHTPLGVEPPSWTDIVGPFESQIGGRDLRKDLPLKLKRQLAVRSQAIFVKERVIVDKC